MRVALTGGTGLLGRAVIERLRAGGHEVRALVRARRGRELPELPGVEWRAGTLSERPALRDLVEGCDAVVHAAFEERAERFVESNLAGTAWLLESAAAAGCRRFVYTSSLAVYGVDFGADPLAGERPRDEDHPLWPREVYGAHKAALEKLVFAAGASLGLVTRSFRLGWCLAARPGGENALATSVDEALEHGELRTPRAGYVLAVADAARFLAAAAADASDVDPAPVVLNAFDRWYDFRETAAPLAELLRRPVAAAAPPCPAPRAPIVNDRLRARGATFATDEHVRAILAELLRARGALPA